MTASSDSRSPWQAQIRRRRFIGGAFAAGAGLSAAALVGCGDDEEDGGGAGGSAPPAGGTTATGTGQPQTAAWPARKPHSDNPIQRIAEELHWSKVRPVTMPANQTPRTGGVAVVGTAGFGLQTLHPTDEPVGQWPFGATHNNLLGMNFENPDLTPATTQYSVSQGWEPVDPTTVVFRLRQGVTWHNKPPANGGPLTFEDIRATYDLFKGSQVHRTRFADIERFEQPEPGVVRLKLNKPASHVINLLRVPAFAILNARHIEEGSEALRTKAIGTGPFTQEKFTPNQSRVFKKNPTFWMKDKNGVQLPYSDGYVMQVIADPQAVLAAFRTKRIDYFKALSIEQFESLRRELDVYASVHPVRCTCSSRNISFSYRNPMFRDVRVRRALSKAVNRQDIIETVFGGAASMNGFIAFPYQGLPWPRTIDEMGEWQKYDVAAARQLLDAAGIARGTTIPVLYQGQVAASGGATGDAYVEPLRRDFRAVGIDLRLEPQDAIGFTRSHYGGQWNGLSSVGVGGSATLDADGYFRFVETGTGLNGSGVSDPTVDGLVQRWRATYDTNQQFDIARQVERYVVDDQVLLGLSVPENFGLQIWHKHLKNVIDNPSWYINGGAGQMFTEMWLDHGVPARDINSF